jgi:hypothetical protein
LLLANGTTSYCMVYGTLTSRQNIFKRRPKLERDAVPLSTILGWICGHITAQVRILPVTPFLFVGIGCHSIFPSTKTYESGHIWLRSPNFASKYFALNFIVAHIQIHRQIECHVYRIGFVLRILHQNTLLLTSLLLIFRFIDKSSVTYIASGLIKEGTVVHTLSESTWSNMKSFVCSVAFPYMLVTIVAAYDDSVSTSISVARCRLDCFEMLPTYHHDTCDYSREDYCQLVGECQQVCTCPYIYM